MIKIPNKIQILGTEWAISYYDVDKADELGLTVSTSREIRLAKGMDREGNKVTPESQLHTFFHELTHAILYELGKNVDNEEEIADSVGGAFLQIFKQLKDKR
jgi:hypothetical protein